MQVQRLMKQIQEVFLSTGQVHMFSTAPRMLQICLRLKNRGIYTHTRLMNPTHGVLEERMAALESGAAALALASGTAAIFYAVINCTTP